MQTNAGLDPQRLDLYQQLDTYPWADDEEFQGGLRAILGSVQDPAQLQHLTLRAKCYYYARKFSTPVDFEGYRAWLSGTSIPTSNGVDHSNTVATDHGLNESVEETGGGMQDAPKPASFAEICDMIAEGKPIPGIKEIPDTILEGQASDSQATKRRKPWETSAEALPPSWMAT